MGTFALTVTRSQQTHCPTSQFQTPHGGPQQSWRCVGVPLPPGWLGHCPSPRVETKLGAGQAEPVPGRSADIGNHGIAELSPLQIEGGLSGGPSLSPGC